MIKNLIVLGLTLISFGQINCVLNPKVVCYYEDWFVWRTGNGKMTVEDVDSSLCTHIVYAYLGVTPDNEVKITDPYLMIDKKDLTKFTDNKGHAKALIAIGGSGLAANIDSMVDSAADRNHFVESVYSFIKKYGFDGISFDWSHTWSGNDFDYFVLLLERFHSVFDGKYTIGITIAARPINFKVAKVDKFVDFISVQTFDFHGSWEKVVGHQAPLNWQISILREFEDAGATPHKLLMTIPLFGHTWILYDTQHTEPGAKASGPGKQGPWSQADGKLSFNEICTEIKKDPNSWQLKEDDKENGAAYAIHERTWVTFESTTTAKNKAKNVTTEGYGGVVVQALANEDFKGLCGNKYPLLHAINEGLNKDDIKERTHPPGLTTTEKPPITADPKKLCHKEGYVRDPKDCNIYHKCTEFFPGLIKDEEHNCPKNEAFDLKEEKCKDKSQVEGCH